jgi:hypothetical protein
MENLVREGKNLRKSTVNTFEVPITDIDQYDKKDKGKNRK